jgi:hypothetical protein
MEKSHFQWTNFGGAGQPGAVLLGLRGKVLENGIPPSFRRFTVPCKNGVPQGSNPKRVSLWEIHPIYSFEVCPSGDCATGGWQPLETFAAGKAECPEADCKVKKNTGAGNHTRKKKGPQG